MARRVGYGIRKLRSGRWQLLVRAADGAQVGMGSYASRADAERAGQSAANEIRSGGWVDPRRSDITVRAWLGAWLERRAATGRHGAVYSTQAERLARLYIYPTLGAVALTDLTSARVEAWYDDLVAGRREARGAAGLIPAKTYRLLRAALAAAVRDNRLIVNPANIEGAGVERSAERPYLDVGQVLDIADHIDGRWRAMVLLAGFVGLRYGELIALERADVDLLHGVVTVTKALGELDTGELVLKAPKTAAGMRTVTIPADLRPDLEQHLAEYVGAGRDAVVFTSPRGLLLRRRRFAKWFKAAAVAAGCPDARFHDLRHAAGTQAAQHGATERELQARLGHSSAVAARRYQHASQARDARLADRISSTIEDARAARPVPSEPANLNAHSTRKPRSVPGS